MTVPVYFPIKPSSGGRSHKRLAELAASEAMILPGWQSSAAAHRRQLPLIKVLLGSLTKTARSKRTLVAAAAPVTAMLTSIGCPCLRLNSPLSLTTQLNPSALPGSGPAAVPFPSAARAGDYRANANRIAAKQSLASVMLSARAAVVARFRAPMNAVMVVVGTIMELARVSRQCSLMDRVTVLWTSFLG